MISIGYHTCFFSNPGKTPFTVPIFEIPGVVGCRNQNKLMLYYLPSIIDRVKNPG